jgi:hypothetical protein
MDGGLVELGGVSGGGGGGGGGADPETTAVGAEVAVAVPPLFEAATRIRSVRLASPVVAVYVRPTAPPIPVQPAPAESQRCHWKSNCTPLPLHSPVLAVSVAPTSAAPVTTGADTLTGGTRTGAPAPADPTPVRRTIARQLQARRRLLISLQIGRPPPVAAPQKGDARVTTRHPSRGATRTNFERAMPESSTGTGQTIAHGAADLGRLGGDIVARADRDARGGGRVVVALQLERHQSGADW